MNHSLAGREQLKRTDDFFYLIFLAGGGGGGGGGELAFFVLFLNLFSPVNRGGRDTT